MALSDKEELELLTLEREKAMAATPVAPSPAPKRKAFGWGGEPTLRSSEAFGAANEALDRTAYKAGEVVNDAAAKVLPIDLAAGAGVAANVGVQMIPNLLGGQAAKLASPALQSTAKGLMQSALKPTVKDLTLGKADRAVQTLLDEGINVTRGGVEKLRGKANAINDVVDTIISTSGSTVDKGAVASRINDVVKRIERTNATPQDALADVEKVYSQFMSNGLVPKDIPLARAQELKQGIYRMLKDKYGQLGSDTVEAQKALARGFKETIEMEKPSVAGLNARASDLWNALNVSERRALVSGNRNPASFGTLAHNPTGFAAWMLDKSDLGKSILARALYSGSEQIPATAARVGIGGLMADSGQPEDKGILGRRISWIGSKQHGND